MRRSFALLVFVVGSCADSDKPVQLGPDTYSITALAAGSRGGAMGARSIATREAGEYCQTLGKKVLVTNIETGNDGRLGTSTVTFRCLSDGDLELQRPNYQQAPNVIIENRG